LPFILLSHITTSSLYAMLPFIPHAKLTHKKAPSYIVSSSHVHYCYSISIIITPSPMPFYLYLLIPKP
jgi:hypothetical protein